MRSEFEFSSIFLIAICSLFGSGCGARTALEETDGGQEPPPGPEEVCVLDEPNTLGEGSSPLGRTEFRYAWIGNIEGDGCATSRVYLGSEPALIRYPDGRVEPAGESFLVMSLATPTSLGRYEVRAAHNVGGEALDRVGAAFVDFYQSPGDVPEREGSEEGFCWCVPDAPGCPDRAVGLRGRLEIDVPGWLMQADLTAIHCHHLHSSCR